MWKFLARNPKVHCSTILSSQHIECPWCQLTSELIFQNPWTTRTADPPKVLWKWFPRINLTIHTISHMHCTLRVSFLTSHNCFCFQMPRVSATQTLWSKPHVPQVCGQATDSSFRDSHIRSAGSVHQVVVNQSTNMDHGTAMPGSFLQAPEVPVP